MAGAQEEFLSGMDRALLRRWMEEAGESPFRAEQVLRAFWKEGRPSYGDVSTIPKTLRRLLSERLPLHPWKTVRETVGPDGTAKHLLEAPDGTRVESVVIDRGARRTVCVSSQAGCPVGCVFCATGRLGKGRNLSAAEMAGQVLAAALSRGPVTNVVFMGMGEPLLNPDAVLRAVSILRDPAGPGLGKRRITVSTAGVVPGIRRMAREKWPVRLAVSLHSADEAVRRRLVPGLRWTPSEIISAARGFRDAVRRTVTVEYVLIDGVNSSPQDAGALVRLLRGGGFKVNLIPWNAVEGVPFRGPKGEDAERFGKALEAAGIPVAVRRSAGGEIGAACGQLRAAGVTPGGAGPG